MNGKQLWTAVRREFKKQYPKGTIHRVENTLERGMSDVVWCTSSCDSGWIELKGEGDNESPIQRTFRNKWNKAGGNACVLMTKWDKFIVVPCLYGYVTEELETLAEAVTYIVEG